MNNKSLSDTYQDHYYAIIKRCDLNYLDKIRTSAKNHSKEIAHIYFDVLSNTDEVKNLFSKELIEKEDIVDYINLQFSVGQKYVRMNIPPHLLNLGSRLLKNEICKEVIDSNFIGDEVRSMYTQIIMLVDLCLSITYEAYIQDKITIERRSQALQNHILGAELAEMCQSIRADIHDWHTLLLNKMLVSENLTINNLPSIKKSDFSFWLGHKANIFLVTQKK